MKPSPSLTLCLFTAACSASPSLATDGGADGSPPELDAALVPPAPIVTSDLANLYTDPATPRQDNFAQAATFTFTSRGATSYQCSLDGAPAQPCSSGASIGVTGYTDHTLAVQAIAAGATSATTTVYWRTAFDCDGGAACREPGLASVDPPSSASNVLNGYADPTLKTFGGTSWMAYSWPTSEWPNGVGTAPEVSHIVTHLAKSTDHGASWQLVGAEFEAGSAAESVDLGAGGSQPGIASSEEIDFDAAMLGKPAKPYWFWIRQRYDNPVSGTGSMKGQTQHLRLGMVQASDPSGMAGQESNELALFAPGNPAAYRTQIAATSRGTVDLVGDLLSAHGLACDIAWSSSVLFNPTDGKLYLLIECNVAGDAAITGTTFPVLRAQPTDGAGNVLTPDHWTWEFVGTFGTPTAGFTDIAPKFRVDPSGTPTNMLIQPSLALAGDGTPLLVSSANLAAGSTNARLGCNVTEVTLDPQPAFVLDATGAPVHRAIVRTPDLGSGDTFGQQAGSCDYDGAIGIMQARKMPRAGGAISTINRTGIAGL
jgi:hypothetical protein